MFGWLYRVTRPLADLVSPPDEYELQARRDQKSATCPGCVAGRMQCLELCGMECNEDVAGRRFVKARAAMLRRGEKDDPDGGSTFTLANIRAGIMPPLPKL